MTPLEHLWKSASIRGGREFTFRHVGSIPASSSYYGINMATNFMDKGIEWFSSKRSQHVTESVLIRTATQERVLGASVVEPESLVSSQGLRVQSNLYYFVIITADLSGLEIARGVQIIRRGRLYEAVIDSRVLKDFNDPNNHETAIAAQLREYQPSVTN